MTLEISVSRAIITLAAPNSQSPGTEEFLED